MALILSWLYRYFMMEGIMIEILLLHLPMYAIFFKKTNNTSLTIEVIKSTCLLSFLRLFTAQKAKYVSTSLQYQLLHHCYLNSLKNFLTHFLV